MKLEVASDNIFADIGVDNPEEELKKAELNWKHMNEKKVKLTAELPESVHRKLKAVAALNGMSIKDYLIYLLDNKEKIL